jgi:hypothetical protein
MKNCQLFLVINASLWIPSVPSSSILFFFRVKAIYHNNKIVTAVFGFLWCSLFALSFLVPISVTGTHIGTTEECIITYIARRSSAPLVLNTIFDTAVFIAISLRIMSFATTGKTFSARAQSFVQGDGLPLLSKSLLQGGQLYYLFVATLITAS